MCAVQVTSKNRKRAALVLAASLPRGPDGLVVMPNLGLTKRKKRARIGSQFASMADLEAAKKARAVQLVAGIKKTGISRIGTVS